jgi:competence protein ComEA
VAAAQLPEGPGKDVTMQICSNCHELAKVVATRQNRDDWTATISKMVDEGAQGTEEQLGAVLSYLVKNFGPISPVNVNAAPASELESKLAITAKEADAIVKYRSEKGPFKTIDDLKKVPDLDFKKIEAKKDWVKFEG